MLQIIDDGQMLGADALALAAADTVGCFPVLFRRHVILGVGHCPALKLHILPLDIVIQGEVLRNSDLHGASCSAVRASSTGNGNFLYRNT